jgi:hypothetical protein
MTAAGGTHSVNLFRSALSAFSLISETENKLRGKREREGEEGREKEEKRNGRNWPKQRDGFAAENYDLRGDAR